MTDADRLLIALLDLIIAHNKRLIAAGLARFVLELDAAANPSKR